MKRFVHIISITLLISCNLEKKEVKYHEMSMRPELVLNNNELIIITANSNENSALSIYEIQSDVDHSGNVLTLKGFQASGKEFRREFKVSLKDLNIKDLTEYKIFWVDPDGRKTKLKVK